MPVTAHPAPPDRLSASDIERWRSIPVAVAVDLVALGPDIVRTRVGDAEAKVAREVGWEQSLADGRSMQETFGLAAAGDELATAQITPKTPSKRRPERRGDTS